MAESRSHSFFTQGKDFSIPVEVFLWGWRGACEAVGTQKPTSGGIHAPDLLSPVEGRSEVIIRALCGPWGCGKAVLDPEVVQGGYENFGARQQKP